MHGLHLKNRNGWWHYFRNRPKRYKDVEKRKIITFAFHTQCFAEAKVKAANYSYQLDKQWAEALERGISLASEDKTMRYRAAQECNRNLGLAEPEPQNLQDDELLKRLRLLLAGDHSLQEQKAVLGLVEKPSLDLSQAFDRFWTYIADEYENYSPDQVRHKRNIYIKSIKDFEMAVGEINLYDLKRSHAIQFREWLMKRKIERGLKAYTGNRELSSLRRLIGSIYDMDGHDAPNPFARVRLKADIDVSRTPLTEMQITDTILAPGKMGSLHQDFQMLVRLLINTGMRPVEAVGLELDDIFLDHDVPHVHVRQNGIRALKTSHSDRLLPLLGVSLEAAQKLVCQGGWGKRAGKNQYATAIINRKLRENGCFGEPGQSLYSLRHYFIDQLVVNNVLDRVQCQLSGHRFNRPKYGAGLPLNGLRDVIAKFAL